MKVRPEDGYANCRRCGRVLNHPYKMFHVLIRPVRQDDDREAPEPTVDVIACQACTDEISETIQRQG